MIKRYLLVILSISLFLSSCVQSPDDMLKQFNDNLYEDIGNGMYQHGDVIILPKLIPREVYPVVQGGTLRLEISPSYFNYTWHLKDNSTGQEWDVEGYYIVYVGRPNIELIAGHNYTLTLNLVNKNGIKYMDTATLNVVENI